jgi:hypothetical protein
MNPSRLSRILARRARKVYRGLLVRVVKNLDLIPIFDKLLPFYLEKHSAHIEWDITFLSSSNTRAIWEKNDLDYNLSRKQKLAREDRNFPNPYGANLAIVVQGPIVSKNSTTLRIIQHYLVRYPEACIVVSTWEDTVSADIAPFVKLSEQGKIRLILNPEPDMPGIFNLNRQIISSKNGLQSVLQDFEYAMKTRTDQVFTSPRFVNHLHTLLSQDQDHSYDQSKIIISSLNTFAFRLYGYSDMFQFGKTKDLYIYWDQPLDTRDINELTQVSANLEAEARKRVVEVYLNTNYYLKKLKKEPIYELTQSLRFIAEYFIVADAHSLGQKWFKNTNLTDRWGAGKFPSKYYEMSHIDWLDLQDNAIGWQQYTSLINSEAFFLED